MSPPPVRTTCNRDCPDACGILATVVDGRVTELRGDPNHPVTRGFLCYRTSRFPERQHHPQRLTAPLLRRGGSFREVSWDDALDLVAERMLRIKSESGPEAILHYRSGGSLGILKILADRFFEQFGPTSSKEGDICSGAGEAAQELDFGVSDSHDLFDLRHSRTIVLWGKNVHVSSVHLLPLLREVQAAGTRIVQVDPVRHRSADLADLYVQPRPGGDLALALGAGRLLFETGRTDPGAGAYCDGLEDYRALCFSRTAGEWAAAADVAPEVLEGLAAAYADGPSAILVGWGMQRRRHGGTIVRALDALGAVSGNLGVPGGGVSFYFRRRGAFDTTFGLPPAPPSRRLLEPVLGRAILEASDPAVRMVWVTCGNPVAMLPDSETVARALASRELTVVVDQFLTDTARAAHLVLPTTTLLEDDDLLGAYGHHWLNVSRPVVAPPPGVRTDLEILRGLARRLAMAEMFDHDAEHWKRLALAPVAGRGVTLEALQAGPVRNPLAPPVLFADRRFPTPSGRANLLARASLDLPAPTPDRPLLLHALSTERAQSSQWAHDTTGPVPATLHPDAAPGRADGDLAVLESSLGQLPVRLRLDPRQRRDVVVVPKGGWHRDARCANALVPAEPTDLGGGACYYDTPVRLV